MENKDLRKRLADNQQYGQSAVKKLEKKRFRTMILIFVIFTTAFGLGPGSALLTGDVTIRSSGSIQVISPLHVEGGKILDANNNAIWLRGINHEHWIYDFDSLDEAARILGHPVTTTENPNGQYVRIGHLQYWTTDKGLSWDTSTAEGLATEQACRDHLTEMKRWGLNCVRYHISISPWINDASRAPIEQYRYHLRRNVEIAEEVGLYVIYDVAEFKQHTLPEEGGWTDYPFYPYNTWAPSTFDEDVFANWWGEVAAYLGDLPNVIFEVYNEPHTDQGYTNSAKLIEWQRIHNKAIAAIRHHSQNLVIAQWYWGLDGFESSPYGMGWVYDYPLTGGNIVYSTHVYRQFGHLGFDQPYERDDIETRLTQMKVIGPDSPTNTNTAPIIIGETGAYRVESNPNEATFLANFLDILNTECVHYVGFEWAWVWSYPMMQAQVMMAPANTAGQILKDAVGGA